MYFDVKAQGKKSNLERTLIKSLESPGLMTSASGISITIFSPSDFNDICNRLKMLLLEKPAGINSNIINDEIIALVEKLLENKNLSTEQQNQTLMKGNLLLTKKKLVQKLL